MKKLALIGCAAVLVTGTAIAGPPELLVSKQVHPFISGPPPGGKTLYDQNKDDGERAILSQNVDDSQAADDFTVPEGHTWVVKEVDVTGVYFDGSGPTDSENVLFYKDKGGLPGRLVAQCPNQNGADNGFGSFAIVLSPDCRVKLKGGNTYWVSVQANIDFIGGAGEWGWELSLDTSGNPAAWQSPGSDCPTWCSISSDLMFALRGRDKV